MQSQVDGLPPYALASDLAAAEGLIAANSSSITALNASLATGLANKANQSALDTLQLEVDGKSTPTSVDTKLQAYSTTAAMNSAIANSNNATLASVAANYALRSVTDQLALDLAAKQSGPDVDQKIATALLDRPSTTDLTAAVNLRTTPADVDQKVVTALLTYVTQVALDAALALRDGRLDGAEASIASLQAAGFQTAAHLRRPKTTRTPSSPATDSDTAAMNQAIADALVPYGTAAQRDAAIAAALATVDLSPYWFKLPSRRRSCSTLSNGQSWSGGCTGTSPWPAPSSKRAEPVQYQNEADALALIATELVPYWNQTEVSNFVLRELANFTTSSSVILAISSALGSYDNSGQVDSKITTALLDYYTRTRSWTPSSGPPSRSTGPAGAPRPRSTTPSPARASKSSQTRTELLRKGSRCRIGPVFQPGAGAVHSKDYEICSSKQR